MDFHYTISILPEDLFIETFENIFVLDDASR